MLTHAHTDTGSCVLHPCMAATYHIHTSPASPLAQEHRDLQARKEEMRAQDQRRMDIMAQKQEAFQERRPTGDPMGWALGGHSSYWSWQLAAAA